MRVCKVIVFVCLFAMFFCENNQSVSNNLVELCFECRYKTKSSCTIQKCSCNDSPKVRFKVNRRKYNLTNLKTVNLERKDEENNPKKLRNFPLIKTNQQSYVPPASPYLPSSSTPHSPSTSTFGLPSSTTSHPSSSQTTYLTPLELEMPKVHCIESDYIILVWNVSKSIPPSTYYYIKYRDEHGSVYETNLTRCNYMKLEKLEADTEYRIELRSFSIIQGQQSAKYGRSHKVNLRTRKLNVKPVSVTAFYIDKWILQDDRKYTVTVRWIKGKDYVCYYNLVYFPSDGDYIEIDVDNPLVKDVYNLTDLELGSDYPIALTPYTLSTSMSLLEGPKTWINMTTPTCLETYNTIELCIPDTPEDFKVKEDFLSINLEARLNVIMEWTKPKYTPEYYTAYLKFIDLNNTEFLHNITGDSTNATFLNIPMTLEYEAILVAYSRRGPSQPAVIHRQVVANYTLAKNEEPLVSLEFVLIVVVPLVIIAIFVMYVLNRILIKKIRTHERSRFFQNLDKKSSRPSTLTTISAILFENNNKMDEWEIDTNKLAFKELLGGGAFGVVRRGWYSIDNGHEIEVAIKMLRDNPTHEEIKQFYQEIELMKSVPSHPNLVTLIGCVTKKNLLLVVEYCSKGDLQSFLRAVSDKLLKTYLIHQESDDNKSKYVSNKMYDFNEMGFEDIPQPKNLISFARQVALGMEYLASLKLIHRDLAARNILISDNNTIKISDFGLSRDVYYDNIYYKASAGKLPIRWMALESMTHQIYTIQSDVWSFGILLWEIITLGGTPYPGIQTQEVLGMLKNGYRMRKPDNCSNELYSIMCQCWNASPMERPSFSDLRKALDDLLATFSNYLNLDTNIILKDKEESKER